MNLIYVLVHFYLYKIYEWIRINNWKIVTICYSFDEGHSVFWLRMEEISQYRFCPETGFKEASQPEMTSIEILKTQEMARECMNSNNKNCGWWKSKRSQKLLLLVVFY